VAFIQKVLLRLSFLQADEPNVFPDLEFLKISHFKGLKLSLIKGPEASLKAQIAKWSLI
jgi:hypothetical protein